MPPLCPQITCLTLILLPALATATGAREAHHDHETRAHAAHVHGVSTLTAVEDAGTLVLELESPGMNLVGFEHAPKTEADAANIDSALTRLRDVGNVASIDGGDCRPVSSDAKSSYPSAANAAPDHEHEHVHENDSHHAFVASYQFQCARPESMNGLRFTLLKNFPDIETLSVQWIVRGKQGTAQVSAANPALRF